jgi:hypothetical protein
MATKRDRTCPKCTAKNRKAGREVVQTRTATHTETRKCERCGEMIEMMITQCLTPDCDWESATEMRPAHDCPGK